MSTPLPPLPAQFWPWLIASDVLIQAAHHAHQQIQQMTRTRRRGLYQQVRLPGPETPVWNALAGILQVELSRYGQKARLARYLGVPRQRISDYLTTRNRMPDAEILLRLLHWLAIRQAGRDLSL